MSLVWPLSPQLVAVAEPPKVSIAGRVIAIVRIVRIRVISFRGSDRIGMPKIEYAIQMREPPPGLSATEGEP
jgi:hypothetical protein